MELLEPLLRFVHVVFGILWMGTLLTLNLAVVPTLAELSPETRRALLPELGPRALGWLRLGAIFSFATGLLLLGVVFHSSRQVMFGLDGRFGPAAGVLTLLALAAPLVYEPLARNRSLCSGHGLAVVGLLLLSVFAWAMQDLAGFTSRALNIHYATALGSILAWNALFRIDPAQRVLIAAAREGRAPDLASQELATTRARHNVHLSIPLVWGMLDQHTTSFLVGNQIPGWLGFLVPVGMTLVGWHVAFHLLRRAARPLA